MAIVYILKDAAVQIWRRLMDGVDPSLVDRLESAAAGAEGVQEVSSVRVRWVGHTLHADALIVADRDLSLAHAHAVAERARHAMHHALPRLGVATIHVDPCGHDGTDPHAEAGHHGVPTVAGTA